MPFKISHKNSLGCELNDEGEFAQPYQDTLDTNDKVIAYVTATQFEPGDILTVIEV